MTSGAAVLLAMQTASCFKEGVLSKSWGNRDYSCYVTCNKVREGRFHLPLERCGAPAYLILGGTICKPQAAAGELAERLEKDSRVPTTTSHLNKPIIEYQPQLPSSTLSPRKSNHHTFKMSWLGVKPLKKFPAPVRTSIGTHPRRHWQAFLLTRQQSSRWLPSSLPVCENSDVFYQGTGVAPIGGLYRNDNRLWRVYETDRNQVSSLRMASMRHKTLP